MFSRQSSPRKKDPEKQVFYLKQGVSFSLKGSGSLAKRSLSNYLRSLERVPSAVRKLSTADNWAIARDDVSRKQIMGSYIFGVLDRFEPVFN